MFKLRLLSHPKPRCIDCGFLAKQVEGLSAPVSAKDRYSSADVFSASPFTCYREAYDLAAEITPAWFAHDETDLEAIADERSLEWVVVLTQDRACEWFQRFSPGAPFEWHLDAHQRRREQGGSDYWQWARLVAGAALGFGFGVLTRFLF